MQHQALSYAELGYPVFPCASKRPLTEHGLNDATTDTGQIERWLGLWPHANWAIRTDGLLVVDIDQIDKASPSPQSNPWPAAYEQVADLAVAPMSLTPSGGKHYLFRQPPGYSLANTTGKLAPNVDTRANGGYIVAPPSVLCGKSYRWLAGELEQRPDQLPLPPGWLLDALEGANRPAMPTPTGANKIPAGQRNAALTSMAGRLRRAGHDTGELYALLAAVNANRCDPLMSEEEVRSIAKSVCRYEPNQIETSRVEHWADQDRAISRPILINLGDVQPQPVRWLWPGRIALGKISLIAGEPGQGKSTMLADLAARVTTGAPWPDAADAAQNTPGSVVLATPASVVLLSAEDDVADTIRPRLDAAGANVRKVSALQGIEFSGDASKQRSFNLESDLPLLEQAIQASADCKLVVVDPVSAYMGQTDSHKNADVRGLLTPLAELASRYGVAVVLVTHFSKGQNRKAMHAPTGSIAYIAAARAAWSVIADRHDAERRLFLPIKNNLARNSGGLAFRVVSRDVAGESVGAIEWEPGIVTMSADEAMSDEPDRGPSALDQAKEWLADYLAGGPKPPDEIFTEGDREGHTKITIKRAKAALGVVSSKDGYQGKSVWDRPGRAIAEASLDQAL